nr:MAG TPA: Major capsid protein [Caudoviricetes sp.]
MASLDVFNTDAFSVQSLTLAINTEPEGQSAPQLLDSLFEEEGVSTTTVSIESENNQLALVADTPRGAPGAVVGGDKRNLLPFNTLHLPLRGVIRADEVQNIRAFGTDSEQQVVESLVNARLLKLRRMLEVTRIYHRVGAVTGKIYDADGTKVLLDIYDRFGIQQQEVDFALMTGGTKVKGKITEAKRLAEDVIGGSGLITGWLGICGRGFYDAFVAHASVEKAFDRYNDGAFLREDNRKGFVFDEVVWKEFYGRIGNINFIDTNSAYLIPIGIPDLLITRNAPADYMDTVNTIGLPFYGSQELLDHKKGVELEAQSNPLSLCTRPRAIIKLKR